jgi:transposase-like protein
VAGGLDLASLDQEALAMSIRWTPRRKAALLNDLATGHITTEAACRLHSLSPDELAEWRRAYNEHGLPGLRTTRLQERRPAHFLRPTKPKKHTPIIQ